MSSFYMETLFKRLWLFIKNEKSLLLISKGVHWEAKNWLQIFAFSSIFVIGSPDINIGSTEGVLILFRRLLKTI